MDSEKIYRDASSTDLNRVTTRRKPRRMVSLTGLGLLLATLTSIGCQSSYNGQTLPSPYYMDDDIQYFAPGPSMKLARTAAALKAARDEEAVAAP